MFLGFAGKKKKRSQLWSYDIDFLYVVIGVKGLSDFPAPEL